MPTEESPGGGANQDPGNPSESRTDDDLDADAIVSSAGVVSVDRNRFRDAVWATEALGPDEKLVALAYARNRPDDNGHFWCARSELKNCTQLSSDRAARATEGLATKGWFVLAEPHRRPGKHGGSRATRYAFATPNPDQEVGTLSNQEAGPQHDPGSPPSDPDSVSSDLPVRRELQNSKNITPLPPKLVAAVRIALDGEGEDIDDVGLRRVVEISRDTETGGTKTTHPVGRLKWPTHRRIVLDLYYAEQTASRPRCDQHPPQPAETCSMCLSEIKADPPDRPVEFLGRIYPPLEFA